MERSKLRFIREVAYGAAALVAFGLSGMAVQDGSVAENQCATAKADNDTQKMADCAEGGVTDARIKTDVLGFVFGGGAGIALATGAGATWYFRRREEYVEDASEAFDRRFFPNRGDY